MQRSSRPPLVGAGALGIASPSPPGALAAWGELASAAAGPEANRKARRAVRQAEDVRLVRAIRNGDAEAFGRLVKRYERRLYWLAYDILLDAEEARDVAQEAFLRLHASLDRYDERRDFVNWLYRIARNLAIDWLRRRRRRGGALEEPDALPRERLHRGGAALEEASPDDAVTRTQLAARVHATLAGLPVEYRMALVLRDLHGMSPREIAEVSDCSYPTARWRLHRARALFREAWSANGADESESTEAFSA